VVITALVAPIGSFAVGVGLARWAEATTGGMAVLAAGVVGLWLGAPLFALLAFGACLITVLRGSPIRRWRALAVMLAAAVLESIVALVGLRLVGGSATPEFGLVVLAIVAIGVLGGGAMLAMSLSRRRMVMDPAD